MDIIYMEMPHSSKQVTEYVCQLYSNMRDYMCAHCNCLPVCNKDGSEVIFKRWCGVECSVQIQRSAWRRPQITGRQSSFHPFEQAA